MNELKPTYMLDGFSNYQWLLYYILMRNDKSCQYILNNFYFDEPTRQFLDSIMEKDENGEISPESTEYDPMVDSLNSFFNVDVYYIYKTNFEKNLLFWDEFQQDETCLDELLYADVIEFNTTLESVHPLKPELLPMAIRDYTIHSAKAMDNASPDYIAVAIIASFSALLGHNVLIQPKVHSSSWRIPPNIWTAQIGPPSSKKTPSINIALKPLNYAIKEVLEPRNIEQRKQYLTDKKVYESKRKALKKELDEIAKSDDETLVQSKAREITNLDKPQLKNRDFLIHDATQEALARKMSENDNGILNIRDELSGWLESMNKQNQSHARAFYLEAYNGTNNYTVERVTTESFTIDRTLMSVIGGIQPSKLTPLLEDRQSGASDDGLMERLIQFSVFPDHFNGEYVDEPFDIEFEERACRLFKNAAILDRANNPLIVTFSSEAQSLWEQWARNHLKRVSTMTESMQAIYGKQTALCAKLALIFHMMNEFDKPDIQPSSIESEVKPDSLKRAFAWTTYIDSHIKRIINYARDDKEFYLAKELLERLSKLEDGFTSKQLSNKGWAMFKAKEAKEQALAKLVEHNYLYFVDEGVGTRVKPVYYKHISILE